MSFLNPQFLWMLLLAIPLIAAYLLKVKPRKQPTNAWFLWDKVLAEKNSSALFQKLRSFLSLLLMLLALVLLCFGLSELRFSEKDNRDIFIVIDQSASMQAQANGRPAIELAKDEAHAILNSLSSGQRASIIVLSDSLTYLTHLSSNFHQLHKVVDEIGASEIPDTKSAGVELVQMLNGFEDEKNLRVVFITDGCNSFELSQHENVEQVNVGGVERENIGIIASDIQPSVIGDSANAMVQLSSSFDKMTEVEVEIYHKDSETTVELINVEVKPGVNDPLFFDLLEAEAGVWEARILNEDVLAIDNTVSMIHRPLPSVAVAIPEKNNYFYQRCIEAFGKTSGALHLSQESSQIKIFHGEVPSSAQGDIIVFSPKGKSSYWNEIGEEVFIHVPIAEQPNHGILKHININEFVFPGARKIEPTEGANIIVKSETSVPLIYTVSKPGQNVVVINLDPEQGDFFLHTGFVTLIYDTAMLLSGNENRLPSTYPMGMKHQVSVATEYTFPNQDIYILEKGKQLMPKKTGVYLAKEDQENRSFSVALLSAGESSLKSKNQGKVIGSIGTGYPLSFWLIIAGIALLVIESICYHRRKAI